MSTPHVAIKQLHDINPAMGTGCRVRSWYWRTPRRRLDTEVREFIGHGTTVTDIRNARVSLDDTPLGVYQFYADDGLTELVARLVRLQALLYVEVFVPEPKEIH